MARQATAEGETVRERVISVPDQIIKLPWENKGAKGKAAPAKSAAPAPTTESESDDDVAADAVAIVTELLATGGDVTRQKVAAQAIRGKKPAVASMVFKQADAFKEALAGIGATLEGENITME